MATREEKIAFLRGIREKMLGINDILKDAGLPTPYGAKTIFSIADLATKIVVEEDVGALKQHKDRLRSELRQLNIVPTIKSLRSADKLYQKTEKRFYQVLAAYEKGNIISDERGFLGFGKKKSDPESQLKNPGFLKFLFSDKIFVATAVGFIGLYLANVAMAIFANTGMSPDFTAAFNAYESSIRNPIVNRIVFVLLGAASYKFGEVTDAYFDKNSERHPLYQKLQKKFGGKTKIILGLAMAGVAGLLYFGGLKAFATPGLISRPDSINIAAEAVGAIILPILEKARMKFGKK